MKNVTASWKTTVAGLVAGLPFAADALVQAYTAGKFTGQSGTQLCFSVAVIVLGCYAADHSNITK